MLHYRYSLIWIGLILGWCCFGVKKGTFLLFFLLILFSICDVLFFKHLVSSTYWMCKTSEESPRKRPSTLPKSKRLFFNFSYSNTLKPFLTHFTRLTSRNASKKVTQACGRGSTYQGRSCKPHPDLVEIGELTVWYLKELEVLSGQLTY